MSRPENSFWMLPWPKKSPLGPQKVQTDPKIKSKAKVRIEENIGNKSCSTAWVDLKTVFEPFPDPQNSPFLQLQISSTSLQLQIFSTSNLLSFKFLQLQISVTSNIFNFKSLQNQMTTTSIFFQLYTSSTSNFFFKFKLQIQTSNSYFKSYFKFKLQIHT